MKHADRFLSASLFRCVASAATIAFALLGMSLPAIAQDNTLNSVAPSAGAPASTAMPRRPARKAFRAARLTYMEGDVRVEQANSTLNSVAALNMPLVEGTVISSGPDGQAEIEFEDGSLARLTPNSGISLANLSVDSSGNFQTRLALLGGLSYLELRAGTKYLYSVDAGGDVITPVENATIRVNFDEPPASVAVLDGTAHFAAAGKSFMDATAGQTVQADPSSDGSVLLVKSTIAPETWDQWNEDRDLAAASEAASETDVRTKFAGDQGYGWSDLDANGSWYDVPGHGQVWQPEIAAAREDDIANTDQPGTDDNSGFDPYGYGSWAYTPAGYAWASGYSWGWLPYRCGLWSFYSGFGWGWSPDPYCGVYGFAGYGYDFNFGPLPRRYRRPHCPIPGPGPIHPIIHGRGGPTPFVPVHRPHTSPNTGPGPERVIAGNTVRPLPPHDSGSTLRAGNVSGSVLGAALNRDYPVNARTHAPVIGVVAATHGVPITGSTARASWNTESRNTESRNTESRNTEFRNTESRNAEDGVPRQSRGLYAPQRAVPAPVYEGGSRPAPLYRPTPAPMERAAPPQMQRQSAPPPAPRASPPPAPAPRSAPAPSPAPKGK